MIKQITSLLIANRGEIACRIIRTAKKMQIKTIAVYTDQDQSSLAVKLADEAHYLGPLPLSECYLNSAAIVRLAQATHACAIHPGYGFLSEDPHFARACEEAGVIFIGPPSQAIESMALKDAAKKIAVKANIPVTPGYDGADQSLSAFQSAADKMGYPVLIKASAGGGGKGMRIVAQPEQLSEALQGAKRESLASFGNDHLILEKYLIEARHIEIQIFRDQHGNSVHLFERDCSLQRRHQKIIEESPALGIPDQIKEQLYQAALRIAEKIHYVGAGTVEFLYLPSGDFYFMEMNTRLQVEHPITEMITGLDLVEWQIRVARGEHLPLAQASITQSGHAIEARVCAEDPLRNFLPTTGTLKHLQLPSEPCRIDSALQPHDKITIYFDSLLAKVIVHAPSREQAIEQLYTALSQYYLIPIITNLPFLRFILKHSAFTQAPIHTQFLEQNLASLLPPPLAITPDTLAQAVKAYINHRSRAEEGAHSPWHRQSAWRLNLPYTQTLNLGVAEQCFSLSITYPQHPQDPLTVHYLDKALSIPDTVPPAFVDKHSVTVLCQDDLPTGEWVSFVLNPVPLRSDEGQTSKQSHLAAPLSGMITQIWVKTGDAVKAGTKLLALEAMKMEHSLIATKSGIVKTIFYPTGTPVEEGWELIDFEDSA